MLDLVGYSSLLGDFTWMLDLVGYSGLLGDFTLDARFGGI